MAFTEKDYLELCIKMIEEKYHPAGSSVQMKQRDFEYLIDLIEENSGIKLSVSTLKRLWRNGTDQNPHPSTLNGLSSLLGYKDWLDFKLKHSAQGKQSRASSKDNRVKKWLILSTIPGTIVIVFLVILSLSKIEEYPNSTDILFTANKTVSVGVPSTVIFNYDVKSINADSFFIQQDWNPNHRDRIDPNGEYFSSIYYMPGFHKTKLVANESILKIIPVHIQTDGWLSAAMYNYDDRPIYLPNDVDKNGILSAQEEDILESNVDIERYDQLTFRNIREFDDLDAHNFSLDTRFKYKEFLNDPCPYIQVTIHTEVHIYYIPLVLKGCESNIALKIGENYKSGRDNDLSPFGTDVYNWQELSLEIENKNADIYLNGEPVFELSFEEDFGKVVGIEYTFSGLGEVDYLELKDIDDLIVFEDSFD